MRVSKFRCANSTATAEFSRVQSFQRITSKLKGQVSTKPVVEKKQKSADQRKETDGRQNVRARDARESVKSAGNRLQTLGRGKTSHERFIQKLGDFFETRLPGGGAADFSKPSTDAGQPLRRLFPSNYADGSSAPAGAERPSAREISNTVVASTGDKPAESGISDMFWAWGQFLDHDIDQVPTGKEKTAISVPTGDPSFDPDATGAETLSFTRSEGTENIFGRRQQTNAITALIDASNVYGSDPETTAKLRSFEGGKLKLSDDGSLPSENGFFIAGDERVNENPALTSLHTLFAREHNRIADNISKRKPHLSDEQVFERARAKVTAEIQAITYNEFLPTLLGEEAIGKYRGYSGIDAQISNSFATAAFRFGHSLVSDQLLLVDEDGTQSTVPLSEAVFNPGILSKNGIDSILRGLTLQSAQEFDTEIVDSLRNSVLNSPTSVRLDLAALNIERGRDHGLPTLNEARESLGLSPLSGFDDPRLRDGVGERLSQVYQSIDDVDLWIGMLAERPVGGGLAGQTQAIVLADQFYRLRAGDRNWYENLYGHRKINRLNNLTLAKIIERNTGVEVAQRHAMFVA